MFAGSGIYGQVPKGLLPSTNLAAECYGGMFGQSHITNAPDLPATTPASGCYYGMFYEAWSLEEGPHIGLTSMTTNCCREMFYSDSNLTSIKIDYTGNFTNSS